MVSESFKITREHKQELKAYAKRYKLSRGSIIRNALRYYIRTVIKNVPSTECDCDTIKTY